MAETGSLLRAIGFIPTQADLANYSTSRFNSSDRISLPSLQSFIETLPPPPTPAQLEANLMEAFRVFDREQSGRIPVAELRHILTSLGERLTEAEADEMLREADPESTGSIDYAALVRKLVQV